jgi:hypothetical protein
MASLRHAFARFMRIGKRIAIENGHGLVMIGQGSSRQETADAGANNDRVPSQICRQRSTRPSLISVGSPLRVRFN